MTRKKKDYTLLESMLIIGVDPAMTTGCGITIIRYYPARMKTEPVIARTFKPLKHVDVLDYFSQMKKILWPDSVTAIGTEESYRGQFKSIPYALGKARGIVEGLAVAMWPDIVMRSYKNKAWKLLAFGSGSISKKHSEMTCEADFNGYERATIIGDLTDDAAEAYHIARATAIDLCGHSL